MTDDWSGCEQPHAPETGRQPRAKWPMYSAATISWLGFLVHNVADLPGQTLLSPETLGPSLITIALLAVYSTGPGRVGGFCLAIWATMNLVGGAFSVLPLPALPFEPEQTLRHYSFHLLYAAAQIPLLVVSCRLALSRPHLTQPRQRGLPRRADKQGHGRAGLPHTKSRARLMPPRRPPAAAAEPGRTNPAR